MPKRIIKDWTASERIDLLTPEAEVFFTRLIMKADDYGNYTGNLKLLASSLFPLKYYTPGDVDNWLKECEKAQIIEKYEVDGKPYVHIPDFGQRMRQMTSTWPQPADNPLTDGGHSLTSGGNVRPEEKRREVEVEEKVKAFGTPNGAFVVVKAKYLHEQSARINGKGGLVEYMEANQTILNLPEYADKFLRKFNGKVFNELSHLQNTYRKFVNEENTR